MCQLVFILSWARVHKMHSAVIEFTLGCMQRLHRGMQTMTNIGAPRSRLAWALGSIGKYAAYLTRACWRRYNDIYVCHFSTLWQVSDTQGEILDQFSWIKNYLFVQSPQSAPEIVTIYGKNLAQYVLGLFLIQFFW